MASSWSGLCKSRMWPHPCCSLWSDYSLSAGCFCSLWIVAHRLWGGYDEVQVVCDEDYCTVPEFRGWRLQVLSSVQSNVMSPPMIPCPLHDQNKASLKTFDLIWRENGTVLFYRVTSYRSDRRSSYSRPWKNDKHKLSNTLWALN